MANRLITSFGRVLTLPGRMGGMRMMSAGSADDSAPPAPAIDPSQVNEFRLVAKKERKKYVKCDVETAIKYMSSTAYRETYGEKPVWFHFRRNFKGHFPPRHASRPCVHHQTQIIMAGNPCPLCRDEYLLADYRNVELLKQFLDPYSGEVLHPTKTGLCSFQHENLLVALLKAWDEGTMQMDVPYRDFDYREWYGSKWTQQYGDDTKGPADVYMRN